MPATDSRLVGKMGIRAILDWKYVRDLGKYLPEGFRMT